VHATLEPVLAAAADRPAGAPLADRFFAPVDIAWLVWFRILLGAMLLIESVHCLANGWPQSQFGPGMVHFTYPGFHWVRPWPGRGMTAHFAAVGVLGLCVSLGLCCRVAAPLLFLAFTYVFLIDQTYYLNHFYLIALLAFLMILLPAHRAGSLDARRRPAIRSNSVPTWTLWLVRFQLGAVYVFGGIAKLNPDWLRGEPMRLWLGRLADEHPRLAPLFRAAWAPYAFSYGGLLLDLLVVPALLWRRTRAAAVVAIAAFHLTNAAIFDIGIFPWLMLGATAVFFEPDWARRAWRRVEARWASYGFVVNRARAPLRATAPAATVAPLGHSEPVSPRAGTLDPTDATARSRLPAPAVKRWVLGALLAWVAVQLLLPLRHWLYPGDVNWNEAGHRFSWHMKLRDKQGDATFFLTDPATGETQAADPAQTLNARQRRLVAVHPEFALQFARRLADERAAAGKPRPAVRVRTAVSLNGRRPQAIVHPGIDLAAVEAPPWSHWPWVLPLTEPLGGTGAGQHTTGGATVEQ
jgi:vitamin K-dependent gamma-carboxylase